MAIPVVLEGFTAHFVPFLQKPGRRAQALHPPTSVALQRKRHRSTQTSTANKGLSIALRRTKKRTGIRAVQAQDRPATFKQRPQYVQVDFRSGVGVASQSVVTEVGSPGLGGTARDAGVRYGTMQSRSQGRDEECLEQSDTFTRYSGYIFGDADGEANQWEEYDSQKIATYYQGRPFLLARRLTQIATTLGAWLGQRWLDSKLGRSDLMFTRRAAELRKALTELGPAFVKIGQAVSSRPDVVPPAYLEELSQLQDRIPPFPTAQALDIIEEDLGVPIETLFSEISPHPVAAASLGQVYQARLRPNGQAVAVKVQRPGVMAAIALDIYILRMLAGFARQAFRLNTDLQAVVDEWAASLFKEMDYNAEARNGLRFRKLFGSIPDVLIPNVYPDLTSKRVLVMEWVEGTKLSEVDGGRGDLRLVEVGVYCSLSQLLDSGFYHADPHPGNLLRTPDGRLAYLDFGMMGEIRQDLREGLIEASVHLVNREYDALALDFVTLGLLPPTADMSLVAPALTGVFQKAVSGGVRNISFGDLSGNLGKTMYQFKFRIPSYFSLVIRSLTVLEGIALASDRNYKVLSAAYPWIARKVLTDKSPQLRATLKSLLYKDGSFRVDRLESLLRESQRPMYSAEEAEAAARAPDTARDEREVLKRVLKFALSAEGEFVRDTLLDEVTKGLDALNRKVLEEAFQAVGSQFPVLSAALPKQLTESEDYTYLDNLRRLGALVTQSGNEGTTSDQELRAMVGTNNFASTSSTYAAAAAAAAEAEDDLGEVKGQRFLTSENISAAFQRAGDVMKRLPELSVVTELPVSAQQAAAMLPVELAGRLASRALARAIRSNIPASAASDRVIYRMQGEDKDSN